MTPAHRRELKLLEAALEAKDYRSFLSGALLATTKEGAKPNIAALSRKAGFSSRSFIGDVIDGRRRLSALSYPKLAKALGLPTKLKGYFHLLVIKEEGELNFEGLQLQQIESKLRETRSKLASQLKEAQCGRRASVALFSARDLLDCYAALGTPETGASLQEICDRTQLQLEACLYAVRFLVDREIATHREGRYFAASPAYFQNALGEDRNMKNCYLQSLDELKRKANADFNAKDRAFYQFLFSFNRAQLPALKQRLWELMQEFSESAETPDGDSVTKLVIGLYA